MKVGINKFLLALALGLALAACESPQSDVPRAPGAPVNTNTDGSSAEIPATPEVPADPEAPEVPAIGDTGDVGEDGRIRDPEEVWCRYLLSKIKDRPSRIMTLEELECKRKYGNRNR